MFKRKIKVKDNRFTEKIEEFLGTEIYQNPEKGELTSEELAAFRYELGDFKVNLNKPNLIQRIGINDLFCPMFSVLTIKEITGTFSRIDKIRNHTNILPLLNQRLILFDLIDGTIEGIRIYIPSSKDIIVYLDYLKPEYIEEHFDFRNINFFVQKDGKVVNEIDWSKEFFAYTNLTADNATIILHHTP